MARVQDGAAAWLQHRLVQTRSRPNHHHMLRSQSLLLILHNILIIPLGIRIIRLIGRANVTKRAMKQVVLNAVLKRGPVATSSLPPRLGTLAVTRCPNLCTLQYFSIGLIVRVLLLRSDRSHRVSDLIGSQIEYRRFRVIQKASSGRLVRARFYHCV